MFVHVSVYRRECFGAYSRGEKSRTQVDIPETGNHQQQHRRGMRPSGCGDIKFGHVSARLLMSAAFSFPSACFGLDNEAPRTPPVRDLSKLPLNTHRHGRDITASLVADNLRFPHRKEIVARPRLAWLGRCWCFLPAERKMGRGVTSS